MANHGRVHTLKHLTQEKVQKALEEINQEFFFGLMIIEPSSFAVSNEPCWTLTFSDISNPAFNYRQCWISSKRVFEMRHGGGPSFLYWVDSLVQDEIAKMFGGKVSDDGLCGRFESWNTPTNFKSYIEAQIGDRNLFSKIALRRLYLFNSSKSYMRRLKEKSKKE